MSDNTAKMPVPSKYLLEFDQTLWGKLIDFENDEVTPIWLTTYLLHRIERYKDKGLQDEDLWEAFREDLDGATEDMFPANSDVCKDFRDFLRQHGVFVALQNGKKVGHNLHQVLLETTPGTWSTAEMQRGLKKGFVSRHNPDARNIQLPELQLAPGLSAPASTPSQGQALVPQMLQGNADGVLGGGTSYQSSTYSAARAAAARAEVDAKTAAPARNAMMLGTGEVKDAGLAGGTSKATSELSKFYIGPDDKKYSGDIYHNLEAKLVIFDDFAQKVGLPKYLYKRGFSIMLTGKAFDRG